MRHWQLLLLLLVASLYTSSATRIIFRNKLQPGQGATLSAQDQFVDENQAENAGQDVDEPHSSVSPTEESEYVNENAQPENTAEDENSNMYDKAENSDNTNDLVKEAQDQITDQTFDQVEDQLSDHAQAAPDIDTLVSSDFPSFRQTVGDQPLDMIITNSPILTDKTTVPILSDKLQSNAPSLTGGSGVTYGGSVPPPPAEYGGAISGQNARAKFPLKASIVSTDYNYGGNVPVNYGGVVPVNYGGNVGATGSPVTYGGSVNPTTPTPTDTPATKALTKELSEVHTEQKQLNSRVNELEQQLLPVWALGPDACPDGWKNLGYFNDEKRVHCEPPIVGDTPGNEKCRNVAKFPQSYDRCGWSRHCKAPWRKFACFVISPPSDVTNLTPVQAPSADNSVKDAEALRQQILKETNGNNLETLTGVPNPPPLNLPSVPPPPNPPSVLKNKAWL